MTLEPQIQHDWLAPLCVPALQGPRSRTARPRRGAPYFREKLASGVAMTVRPASFEEVGDVVVVYGSMWILCPEGGFGESHVRWIYRFTEGLLEEAREPA